MDKIKEYFVIIICLLITAVSLNIYFSPYKIIIGGINGIGLIINKLTNLDTSIIILIISIIFLIISEKYLGTKNTVHSVIITIIYPLFIYITKPLNNIINLKSVLISTSIIIGLLTGIASGTMYKLNFNGIGIPTIIQILNQKTNISYGKLNMIINSIIIIIGGFLFGIKKVVYGLIVLIINSNILNIVVNNKNM